jgi:hypothetical protein
MLERLTRLCLAVMIAFVFTGRMEAAAAHCVRLAQAEQAAVAAPIAEASEAAMPCHGAEHDAAAPVKAPEHHKTSHDKAGDRCMCVGVLKACAGVAAATGSAQVEFQRWVRPQAASFASIEPAPALKPPRA